MSLGEIIRNKREELGLTLDEVSIKVKFSKPYLSTIETGRVNNPPSDELLQKLERVLGFEQGSLLYMAHLESAPTDVREKYESALAENEKYRQMLKKGQAGGASEIKDESKGTFSAGRLVPIINKVTAGYPADFDDLDYPVGIADDYVRCPGVHDPNAFAVYVIGDSMEPKFKEGDIVVFSPKIQAQNGDDCFVRFATPHETTFKRVYFEDNNYRLQPRNEKYAPMVVESKRVNGLYKAIAKVERL
jgi:phage repressor protein C with HTH and peptisase S24 domain